MDCDDGVLEAARAIRSCLTNLVGPAEAGVLDRRIADMLTGPTTNQTSAAPQR
jgi:hypothetical protein